MVSLLPPLTAGVEDLIRILLDQLWEHFIGPVIFWPLEMNGGFSASASASELSGAGGRDAPGALQQGAPLPAQGPSLRVREIGGTHQVAAAVRC